MTTAEDPGRDPEAEVGRAALPEAVRARVVALAARVLPSVDPLPASLRKVATFAPGRRTRLGATPIAAALATDPDLGRRIATQVAAADAALAPLAAAGPPPPAADPVDVAALQWLARPAGWEAAYADAVARVGERARDESAHRDHERVERLERRVEELEDTLRGVRARSREQVEELKAENATLRRRLGDARAAEREARTAREAAEAGRVQDADAAAAATSAAEAEVRRLRAQVEELQAALGSARSQSRADRDEVTTRARILLDTVLEAAAGLRRELALPAVTSTPGVRAEAEIGGATGGDEQAPAGGPVSPVSPAVLEQLLSRPRSRLIVDGYNVTKTAFASSSLEAQRVRLLQALGPLVARTGAETTVVFDAAGTSHRPVVPGPRSVRVVYSPPGVIADDVIRRLADAEPDGRATVVVTSDQELRRDVTRAGARVVDAAVLAAALR